MFNLSNGDTCVGTNDGYNMANNFIVIQYQFNICADIKGA